MRSTRLWLALAFIVSVGGVSASAQVIIRVQPNSGEPALNSNNDFDSALVSEVFAPITEQLNLTTQQKLKIAAIVTATMLEADPLMEKLDQLDTQLDEAALAEPFDEARIRELSGRQSELMGQIIAMKTRAKARMYQLLDPEQRAMVTRQFGSQIQKEASLGAISN
jgi:hypothetical protein